MMRKRLSSVLFWCLLQGIAADFYLHNPRGSNDRLNEANSNRNNANRLFDTQNNAKGGYCYGPAMSYYEGSKLSIQFSPTHGCASGTLLCTVVLQYMCSTTDADPVRVIRDGVSTNTITNVADGATSTTNGQLTYGMHEDFAYFTACQTRQRNKGLWIANRNIGGEAAIFTRQNNNGIRYGYECPEERDYYPYWTPTPWKDIAVLTDDITQCPYYIAQSQNVAPRSFCADANGAQANPITQASCTSAGLTWKTVPAFGIPAPACTQPPAPVANGNMPLLKWTWTVPRGAQETCIASDNCNCVLRVRYNVSSSELAPTGRTDSVSGNFIDWTYNAAKSPIQQDPLISFPPTAEKLALAADTSQFGRIFEDRSHVFHISPRPAQLANSKIFNLNVQGKRGNNVQTFPALQYDYVPKDLSINVGDFIHFQWTGCDTNPAGNAGEGMDQTDRSNIVQLENYMDNYPAMDFSALTPLFKTEEMRELMAGLNQTDCLSMADLMAKNYNNQGAVDQDPQNCFKLNAAGPYFNGGLMSMDTTGVFYYMGTRNNNFSNREQKGSITVKAVAKRDESENALDDSVAWVKRGLGYVAAGVGAFTVFG